MARDGPIAWFGRVDALALTTLTACALVDALLAGRALDPGRSGWFAASVVTIVAILVVTGVATYHRLGQSVRRVAISPFSLAAGTWIALFLARPIELYVAPDHSAIALSQLGFQLADLTRTTAIGGVGCAAWCAGYLLGLGPRIQAPAPSGRTRDAGLSPRGATAALALGTILWGALFMRQGGPAALIHSPASIRVNQGSSFYGFVGVWIVQGVTLYALAVLLRTRTRAARLVFLAGVVLTVAAGAALQLRSLTAFTAVAAVAVYLAVRRPSRRAVAVGVVVVVVAAFATAVAQEVRALSTTHSTTEAIELTMQTPVWAMYVSDLSTYDNFVEMQSVVPASIPYLDGRTLVEIPAALVPRTLWPAKPLGIDFEVASYLYPGVYVAVPISVQGELYWNGGVPLVVVGALVLGLALGMAARAGLRTASAAAFVFYAVTLPFTHGLLTRGLATTIENLVLALMGIAIAVTAAGGIPPRVLAARAIRAVRRRLTYVEEIGRGYSRTRRPKPRNEAYL